MEKFKKDFITQDGYLTRPILIIYTGGGNDGNRARLLECLTETEKTHAHRGTLAISSERTKYEDILDDDLIHAELSLTLFDRLKGAASLYKWTGRREYFNVIIDRPTTNLSNVAYLSALLQRPALFNTNAHVMTDSLESLGESEWGRIAMKHADVVFKLDSNG